MFYREDMALIQVSVMDTAGRYVQFGDGWTTAEGGNLEADDGKARPGRMGMEVSLGGPASRDDVTCTIPMTDVVVGWHKTLEQRVIESAPMKVAITPLNRLRVPNAASTTVLGTIKSAFMPNHDANSGDPAMYSLIMACNEQAA